MKKHDNPLLDDDEACDMLRQLLNWGYDPDQIANASREIDDEISEGSNNEDNFVN